MAKLPWCAAVEARTPKKATAQHPAKQSWRGLRRSALTSAIAVLTNSTQALVYTL
jgi:hypothetical protein